MGGALNSVPGHRIAARGGFLGRGCVRCLPAICTVPQGPVRSKRWAARQSREYAVPNLSSCPRHSRVISRRHYTTKGTTERVEKGVEVQLFRSRQAPALAGHTGAEPTGDEGGGRKRTRRLQHALHAPPRHRRTGAAHQPLPRTPHRGSRDVGGRRRSLVALVLGLRRFRGSGERSAVLAGRDPSCPGSDVDECDVLPAWRDRARTARASTVPGA